MVFLEAACDGNTELRREVESLLVADAGSVSVLDRSTVGVKPRYHRRAPWPLTASSDDGCEVISMSSLKRRWRSIQRVVILRSSGSSTICGDIWPGCPSWPSVPPWPIERGVLRGVMLGGWGRHYLSHSSSPAHSWPWRLSPATRHGRGIGRGSNPPRLMRSRPFWSTSFVRRALKNTRVVSRWVFEANPSASDAGRATALGQLGAILSKKGLFE